MRRIYNDPSSDKSERKAEKHKERTEDGRSGHLRKYKKAGRIDTHHIHGINLLSNAHAADLRRDVRTHLSSENQGNHGGAELQDETFPDHISDIHLVNYRIFKV